jgi:hypothetical protein
MIYDETINEYGFDPQAPVPVLDELHAYLQEPAHPEPEAATAYDQLPLMVAAGEELVEVPDQEDPQDKEDKDE